MTLHDHQELDRLLTEVVNQQPKTLGLPDKQELCQFLKTAEPIIDNDILPLIKKYVPSGDLIAEVITLLEKIGNVACA